MKKLLIFLIIFFCCIPVFADTIYEIETSRGIQQVVVPDGYTEKDVMLTIAKAYYELNWDFEDLTAKSQVLIEDLNKYIADNKQLRSDYDILRSQYEELILKFEQLSRLTPLAGIAGVGFGYYKDTVYPSINIGVELYERFSLITSIHLIDLQPAIGIGINYHF